MCEKTMKRTLSFLLAFCLALTCFVPVSAEKDAIYDLTLDSQGVYVFNTQTGTPIYEKAQDSRMFPASTTKIMTALVALELCEDPKNETVTVPDTQMFEYIIEDGGVHMQLLRGETFTVYDLLVGLMMSSFCDVADLIGYHFGNGNVSDFIAKMNQKAESLGLENTHFENTHGLHGTNHYSSPKDIAAFFAEAMKNPFFREIISLRNYTIPATDLSAQRQLKYTVSIYYPTNDYYLDSFIGGKSGFTDQAGRCLVTYSEQDGISFISVLLGANMDSSRKYNENMAWVETHMLISYCYENFELQTVLHAGDEVAKVGILDSETKLPVLAGEDIVVLTRKGAQPSYRLDLPDIIHLDQVQDKKQIGTVKLVFNDEESEAEYPLLLSWDKVPITTKSKIEKGAESAFAAVSGLFRSDKIFLTLLILLLFVVAICIPAMKITQILHKKKSHRPKH